MRSRPGIRWRCLSWEKDSSMVDAELNRLAERAGRVLQGAAMLLASAESCTGGWVGEVLTSIPGSSAWYERGFITYSNDAKREMLGVSERTLREHGAVSEETAREMALGALKHSRAQAALAVTGVAGPGGGTPEKPVGMVCFAWAIKDRALVSTTRQLQGDRAAVRQQSVAIALQGFLQLIEQAGETALA
jgi:nicotinamide-nucleotide amidase